MLRYTGTSPWDMVEVASSALRQMDHRFSAILLNPAHMDLVDTDMYSCYVHADAPIGAVLYLPEPETLGGIIRSNFDRSRILAGVLVRGPVVTLLTEDARPRNALRDLSPVEEYRRANQLRQAVEKKVESVSEPEPQRDVWDRLISIPESLFDE